MGSHRSKAARQGRQSMNPNVVTIWAGRQGQGNTTCKVGMGHRQEGTQGTWGGKGGNCKGCGARARGYGPGRHKAWGKGSRHTERARRLQRKKPRQRCGQVSANGHKAGIGR